MANATTLRKRIAAVAVAAMGLGVLNSAPASAAPQDRSASLTLPSSGTYLTTYADDAFVIAANLTGSLATNNQVTVTASGEVYSSATDTWSASAALDGKLSFATTFGTSSLANTNTANNATVAASGLTFTVNPASATYSNAVGRAYLKLDDSLAVGTYRVKFTLSDTGTGTFDLAAPGYVGISVRTSITSSVTASPGSASVSKGGATTTFTVTEVRTGIAGFTGSRTIAAPASSGIQINVTPSAVGGSAINGVDAVAESETINYTKDSAEGTFTATLLVSVYVPATVAAGLYEISYGSLTATTFKLTVTTSAFAYSSVAVAGVGTGFYAEVEEAVYAPKTYSATAVATATVTQKDVAGNTIDNVYSKAVTATITGVGSLEPVNPSAGAYGSAQFLTYLAGTSAARTISVYPDGRAGKGTVAIAVDGKVVKTFDVKFYGAATKIEVVPIYSIGEASATGGEMGVTDSEACTNGFATGTADNDPSVAVYVKDANGFAIPATTAGTLTAASSDVTVVKSVDLGFMDGDCSKLYSAGAFALHYTYTTAVGVASGKSADLTWKFVNPDGTSVTSTPITIKTGGAVAKVVLKLDKTSYAPGEKAVLTVTATDASGNAVYDNQKVTGSLVTNLAVGSALPTASTYSVGGTYEYKIFAPSVAGEWTISGKDALGTAISVTAKVVADTTAIDAAKAAADAAKAEAAKATAAVAALSATVTSIQTAIAALVASTTATLTALTAKINKIMKKFKIK